MQSNDRQKHQFALYLNNLSALVSKKTGDIIQITDTDFIHRVLVVLRLTHDQMFTIFDKDQSCTATLTTIVKHKSITLTLGNKKINSRLHPEITFLLPLLKKEALETALYSLTEVGVNRIQLVTTQKSQQKWTAHEEVRAHKIIIAAAEQCKNFSYPLLVAPVSLEELLPTINKNQVVIFLDPAGKPLSTILEQVTKTPGVPLTLLIGPEGDLILAEKNMLTNSGVVFCALTPTVLRACQAAALAAGVFRALHQ